LILVLGAKLYFGRQKTADTGVNSVRSVAQEAEEVAVALPIPNTFDSAPVKAADQPEPADTITTHTQSPPKLVESKTQSDDQPPLEEAPSEPPVAKVNADEPAEVAHQASYRSLAAAILSDPDFGGDEPVGKLLSLYRFNDVAASAELICPAATNVPVTDLYERYGKPEKTEPVSWTDLSSNPGPFGVPNMKTQKLTGHVYGCVAAVEDPSTSQIVKLRLSPPPGGFLADVWNCLKQRPPVRLRLVEPDPKAGVWQNDKWHVRVLSANLTTRLDFDGRTRTLKRGTYALAVELEVTALAFDDHEAPGATIQQSTIGSRDVRILLPGASPFPCEFLQFKSPTGTWSNPSGFGASRKASFYPHAPRHTIRTVAIRDKPLRGEFKPRVRLFYDRTPITPADRIQ
jgi:hypothetical protein